MRLNALNCWRPSIRAACPPQPSPANTDNHYTTFCRWRARRSQAKSAPAFVQVELDVPPAPAGLIVELGGSARLRIESADQIALAAQLLQHLNGARPC